MAGALCQPLTQRGRSLPTTDAPPRNPLPTRLRCYNGSNLKKIAPTNQGVGPHQLEVVWDGNDAGMTQLLEHTTEAAFAQNQLKNRPHSQSFAFPSPTEPGSLAGWLGHSSKPCRNKRLLCVSDAVSSSLLALAGPAALPRPCARLRWRPAARNDSLLDVGQRPQTGAPVSRRGC